jgi:uncharacterized protein YjiS (DUF1127 family)
MASFVPSVSVASAPAPRSAAFHVRALRAAGEAWKAWRNRREFYRLGEMSDAELADIGLRRSDLSVAVGLPFNADPTTHLGAIASARLRAIEDGAREVC